MILFRRPRWRSALVSVGACLVGIVIGASSSGHPSASSGSPSPTVTAAPAPAVTVTETVTAAPPPPSSGEVIGKYSGTGSAATPKFQVPDGGSFEVSWEYSGNIDDSFGGNQPSNFSVEDIGHGYGDLPNDIAASGHGSTVVSGDVGTDRLDVQAKGSWTIVVKAA